MRERVEKLYGRDPAGPEVGGSNVSISYLSASLWAFPRCIAAKFLIFLADRRRFLHMRRCGGAVDLPRHWNIAITISGTRLALRWPANNRWGVSRNARSVQQITLRH